MVIEKTKNYYIECRDDEAYIEKAKELFNVFCEDRSFPGPFENASAECENFITAFKLHAGTGIYAFTTNSVNGRAYIDIMNATTLDFYNMVKGTFIDAMGGDGYTMDKYQEEALTTAIYPSEMSVIYPSLGLNGEAGEVADKVKKLIRDKGWTPGTPLVEEDRKSIAKEIGDVLWYVATLSHDLGYALNEIADMNIRKLKARKEKGVLNGSGDNR